jgi:hypothetical protein
MNKLTGNNEEHVFFRLWRSSWIFLVTTVMENFDKNGASLFTCALVQKNAML